MNLLDVRWDEAMEEDLRVLFLAQRCLPPLGDVSTPELLALAKKQERAHCDEFMATLKKILTRQVQPALDCEVLGAVDRMKVAHDAAQKRLSDRV